jgi:hypothetical protein
MGRAAGGGAGRSWGMGKFKIDTEKPKLSGPGFVRGTRQTQEDQQSKHRDADCSNHRFLGRSKLFQPRDHSAWRPRPRKWAKGYIRIGTLVPPLASAPRGE